MNYKINVFYIFTLTKCIIIYTIFMKLIKCIDYYNYSCINLLSLAKSFNIISFIHLIISL